MLQAAALPAIPQPQAQSVCFSSLLHSWPHIVTMKDFRNRDSISMQPGSVLIAVLLLLLSHAPDAGTQHLDIYTHF